MNRKVFFIIASVILLSLLGAGIASAFSIGNVDGVWGKIDTYENENPEIIDVIGVIGSTSLPGTSSMTRERKNTICAGKPAGTNPMSLDWDETTGASWGGLGSARSGACTTATDLFFSEHVYKDEGSGNDDRVGFEIYNGTAYPINLHGYSVLIYYQRYVTINYERVILPAYLLQPGDVYVLVSQNATGLPSKYNLPFESRRYYHAIVLEKGYQPEVKDGAECARWVSGGVTSSMWSDDWWNQTVWNGPTPPAGTFNQDENLVLYGRETEYKSGSWTQVRCNATDIANQSGFGFRGVDEVPSPQAKEPFFLGEFTHYNNPIFAHPYGGSSSNSNDMQFVELTITVPVTCNDGTTSASFEFPVLFELDETSNGLNPCPYGPDRPPFYDNADLTTHCWDKVTTYQTIASAAEFECPDGKYTVNILGFIQADENGVCSDEFDSSQVATEFITKEGMANPACLWAEIDQPVADLAVAKTCQEFENDIWGDEFYRIVVNNAGPGSSREVQIVDTLPAGANYDATRTWTSKLTAGGVTNNQGTCTIDEKTVTCKLLTPLPDRVSDPSARWTIDIPVTLTEGDLENTVTVSAATYDPDLDDNTATATCESTAACMVSFEAVNAENGILLTWETASEVDNLGFNLYRAESPELPGQKINTSLIPSTNPGSIVGSTYEYLDSDLASGEYFYWLEDLDFALSRTLYGPISVRAK